VTLVLLLVLQAADHPLSAEQRAKIDQDCDAVITKAGVQLQVEPSVQAYSERGDAYFKRGQFAKAVADYDAMVVQDPKIEKSHWRRGIAYFYAGLNEKAARQFETYDSFDNVDRENGIWRYFSQVKAFGKERAREGLLKYAKDDREPFPDVYRLFEGKRTPDQIVEKIKTAEIDDEQREMRSFYAHLYIGLNFAVEGKTDDAIPHLRKAVANKWGPRSGYGPEYMWQVGRLHYELLTAPKKN
jgi:lipoprotein NlpI